MWFGPVELLYEGGMIEEIVIRIKVEVGHLGKVDNMIFWGQSQCRGIKRTLMPLQRNIVGDFYIGLSTADPLAGPCFQHLAHILAETPCGQRTMICFVVSAEITRSDDQSSYLFDLSVLTRYPVVSKSEQQVPKETRPYGDQNCDSGPGWGPQELSLPGRVDRIALRAVQFLSKTRFDYFWDEAGCNRPSHDVRDRVDVFRGAVSLQYI